MVDQARIARSPTRLPATPSLGASAPGGTSKEWTPESRRACLRCSHHPYIQNQSDVTTRETPGRDRVGAVTWKVTTTKGKLTPESPR